MADTHVIEVRNGIAEPARVELRPGVELSPLGIGTEGSWRVQGDGILGVHAYIYFDGDALFVQSADDNNPALVNGRAVGCTWTPVTAPSTISLAGVDLMFRSTGPTSVVDSDRTRALPRKVVSSDTDRTVLVASPAVPPGARPPRPFKPGEFAHRADEATRLAPSTDQAPDSEATRVVPLGETPAAGAPAATSLMGRPAPIRPAAGMGRQEVPTSPHAMPHSAFMTPMPPPLPPGELPPGMPPVPPAPRAFAPTPMQDAGLGPMPPLDAGPPQQPFIRPPLPGSGPYPTPGPVSMEAPPPTPHHPPPGLINVPPPPAPPPGQAEGLGARAKRELAQIPPARKAIMGLSVVAVLMCLWWISVEDAAPPPPRPGGGPAGSASTTSSTGTPAVPSTPLTQHTPTATAQNVQPYPTPSTPGAVGTNLPAPIPSGPGVVTAPPKPTKPVAAVVDAGSGAAEDATAPPVVTDKRERQAADFVSTGQYDQAVPIYDQLAAEHPENPAYREAARILRMKIDAGIR